MCCGLHKPLDIKTKTSNKQKHFLKKKKKMAEHIQSHAQRAKGLYSALNSGHNNLQKPFKLSFASVFNSFVMLHATLLY